MEAVYACHLTFEQFKEEVKKNTAINTFTGHLICSRDRSITEKELWPAYRSEFLAAKMAGVNIPRHVIDSNNDVIIGQISNGTVPRPACSPPVVAKPCTQPLNAKGRPFSWSHSAKQEFAGPLGCPRKYAHSRFYCEATFQETPAMREGNQVHKAAEDFIKYGTIKNPEHFASVDKYARLFRNMKETGIEILPELEIVLDRDSKLMTDPKAWFSKDAWFRCKIDVPVFAGQKASVYDWKTGAKIKEDYEQLHLCLAAISIIRPEIEQFSGKLIWTKHQDVTGCPDLDKAGAAQVWEQNLEVVERMEAAWAAENFPARKNGLCREYCDVLSCAHNGRS